MSSRNSNRIVRLRALRNVDICKIKQMGKLADKVLVDASLIPGFLFAAKDYEAINNSFNNQHTELINLIAVEEDANLDSEELISVLSKCLSCWRLKPRALPDLRISKAKPFSCVGVDFGGPFLIRANKLKNAKRTKAYICLFVCFATKALHLELVSELSTEAFLASFRRFIARRARCSVVYSDCGTNFVGAKSYLEDIKSHFDKNDVITWHLNPPAASHFGGLFEAGIKSVKTHVSRVIGEQVLTYEEFNTLLIQIETILNSRPVCPVSNDPNDFSVLTPGHFLTLEPLKIIPDRDYSDVHLNRLSRWQLLQRLHADFWQRWSREYLHTLHQRSK
ncbi:uncharacterized protein [Diabrotica undecimpunctata]|uniref:uncharacterized protein n=1 Tax=Diabrotica undecimpunctata TaxID=50387 RepID=UPI003B6365EB